MSVVEPSLTVLILPWYQAVEQPVSAVVDGCWLVSQATCWSPVHSSCVSCI